ncbi:spheroidene monooxygenase [Rhodovulum sulfidophilum]|uniref:spheroidene monooxygenase n=1 Tax=Rhodovulum sulfidophilum TaxID=35806 RepID=UPI001924487B|nr:spheroidene monooxygenase [Rhodovulum sulfidophilum]MBL3573834.1 spheroidene monooxygenase [Rhodovulum sulfidophilum]MCE8431370.1 spheroidene monooxygenase [Rhodovulum sulfidophilum]MCF4115352.1 spheroidene monooxygenase [Rhodovulum sulfidophilum]
MQVVTISFFRYDNWASRLEALSQMARGRFALKSVPGLEFFKLLGTGSDEGFNPRPNVDVNAILCVWPDMATAKAGLKGSITHRTLRDHSCETYTIYLTPTSARGLWSGVEPLQVTEKAEEGPLAVLTRATVKLPVALQFWKHVPQIQKEVAADPTCVFHMGLAEVPWVQQVTFSLWQGTGTMAGFAHGQTPHGRAIRAAYGDHWFKEDLYARFKILEEEGTWEGGSPMAKLKSDSRPAAPAPAEPAATEKPAAQAPAKPKKAPRKSRGSKKSKVSA